MLKGIIFDLDGTLLNTLADITTSLNLTLKKYGVEEVDEETVRLRVGNGSRVLVERSLPHLTAAAIDEALADYKQNYAQHFKDQSYAYPGIKELIKQLAAAGIKIGVNTNKFEEMAKELVKKHFSKINTELVLGQVKGRADKPSPQAAEELLKKMGLSKAEVLFVGDSATDIQTGKNAGLKTVGVAWGYRGIKVLKENAADVIIEEAQQLADYIKGENAC